MAVQTGIRGPFSIKAYGGDYKTLPVFNFSEPTKAQNLAGSPGDAAQGQCEMKAGQKPAELQDLAGCAGYRGSGQFHDNPRPATILRWRCRNSHIQLALSHAQ